LYVVLIILFAFFYTNLQVDPEKIAENLGKSGTYILGIRPGDETKKYLSTLLNRITVVGAISLAFIAILPHAIPLLVPALKNTNVGLGGTGVIIVVGVAIETVKSLTNQVTQKTYKGFLAR
jgi:preprotein translocase subunit SecY